MTPGNTRKRVISLSVLAALVLVVLAGLMLLVIGRSGAKGELDYKNGMIYLDAGNIELALASFRAALQEAPDYLEAQKGIVRALAKGRRFREAAEQLDKAVEMGYGKADAAMMRSSLHSMEAEYRLLSAGSNVTVELCDLVLTEDLQPAVDLAERHAAGSEHPAAAYTQLGDLRGLEARVRGTKWRLLVEAKQVAESLDRTEEAGLMNLSARKTADELQDAQKKAVDSYVKAIQLDPSLPAPRVALARDLLGRYAPRPARVREVLDPVIQAEPGHVEARMLLAAAERVTGNYDKALEHLKYVHAEEGGDFELLLAKAHILVDANRWDEAGPVTADLIVLRPSSPAAAYLRGRVLVELKDPESLRMGVSLLQNIFAGGSVAWPQARFALARGLEMQGSSEQALTALRAVLGDVKARRPSSMQEARQYRTLRYEANLRLAQRLLEDAPPVAFEHARQALVAELTSREALKLAKKAAGRAEQPQLRDLVLLQGAALAADGEYEDAIALCRSERDIFKDKRSVDLLLARCLARSGSYSEAIALYRGLGASGAGGAQALFEEADLHVKLKRLPEAAEVYWSILELDPRNARALVSLAALEMGMGHEEQARELMYAAAKLEGSPSQARMNLIRLYGWTGDYRGAADLAKLLAEEKPDDAALAAFLAEIHWLAGDTEEASVQYDRARNLDPLLAVAYRGALLDISEGRPDAAIEVLREGIKQLPLGALKLYLALAYQAKGDLQSADQALAEIVARPDIRPGSLDFPRTALAVLKASEGDLAGALELNSRVTGSEHLVRDRAALLRALASAPEEARVRAGAGVNKLLVFSSAGLQREALPEVQKVAEMLPDEPLPRCWRLQIMDGMGRHEEAVGGLQELIAEEPDFATARMLLAASHADNGEEEEAIVVLGELREVAYEEQLGWIDRTVGDLYLRKGDAQRALQAYRRAMDDATANSYYTAHTANKIAWLLAGNPRMRPEALAYAKRAHEILPDDPAIADTLGWLYYQLEDYPAAVENLRKARAGLPRSPTVRYHIGVALVKTGEIEEARGELQNALSLSQDFPEAQAAREALEQIGAP